jgi:heat shock protein HtpX
MERDLGQRVGCMVIGVSLLAVAFVGLLVFYVSATGSLPFTFIDGPRGIPPWAPLVVLLTITFGAVLVPIVLARFGPDEPTFRDQIAANDRNSLFLTVALVGGVATTAYVLFTVVSLRTSVGLLAALLAVVAGIVGAVVAYLRGDTIVLSVSGARALADDEQPELRHIVSELAIGANLPQPRLYLIDDTAPNGLATGRDPEHSAIAVTTGLLSTLTREELQAVIAHELAHIRNRDTRYDQFVAVMAGTTALVADAFFKVVTFPYWIGRAFVRGAGEVIADGGPPSMGGSSHSRRVSGRGSSGSWSLPDLGQGKNDNIGGAVLVLVAVALFVIMVVAIAWVVRTLAPMFSRIVQAAVNREREFLADASAVEIGRNPHALETALLHVASTKEVLEVANRATVPLYFVNPIRAWEERASTIFSTHPPTIERINRLRALQGAEPLTEEAVPALEEEATESSDPKRYD